MGGERRKTGRVGVRLNVETQRRKFWFLKGPKQNAQAVNLSRGGMKLLTREKLAPGQALTLHVHRDTINAPTDFKATVRWTKAAREGAKSYYFVGVQFDKLRDDQKRLVKDFI